MFNTLAKSGLSLILSLGIAMSPVLSLAQSNENREENEKTITPPISDENGAPSPETSSPETLEPQKAANPEEQDVSSSEKTSFGNAYMMPLGSFVLPGLGQWGSHPSRGLLYSGLALTGVAIAARQSKGAKESIARGNFYSSETAIALIGLKLYDFAGSFSAYESFSTVVKNNPQDFAFIKKRESVNELIKAPFDFSMLRRKTTWIPLAIAGSLLGMASLSLLPEAKNAPLTLFTSGSLSYMAGTGEEALFRGWLLPATHHSFQSPEMANLVTSLAFGAVHYSAANPLPVAQLLMGWYFGYLTQKNNYSLKESIFLHTWYDIFAITAQSLLKNKNNGQNGMVFYQNLLEFQF